MADSGFQKLRGHTPWARLRRAICSAVVIATLGLTACSSGQTQTPAASRPSTATSQVEGLPQENPLKDSVNIPDTIAEIPQGYFSTADQQGSLVEVNYDTYESMSYEDHSQQISKRAIVYLPYGYSDDQQYNIFYLMHGGWSNETTTFGTPNNPSLFKNVVDNAIADGVMEPMIIVCPTYNNTSSSDSSDFSLAMQLTNNYHNELLNDLMPAVESQYSSYATEATPQGFMDSRDHRGFGGFSMGSVATWRTFQYDLDYFHYFLPMSCGTSLDMDDIVSSAQGRDPSDYFVWIMTGTNDFAHRYDERRADELSNMEFFTEANNEEQGNLAYREKDGYSHNATATFEYTYNGLSWFWSE